VTRVLVVSATAFGSALVLVPVAMVVAKHLGVLDRPGPLKPQSAPVPYLGGVAVFLAALVGVAVGRPVVVVPMAGAVVLGVLDDRFDIPAWTRLAGQVVLGVGVALAVPTRVGGVAGVILVAVLSVVLMNGANFLDGIDALAAGVIAVACVAFAVLVHGGARDVAAALAAALAAFLVFNRPPARIYLGDAGAYVLGSSLAVLLAAAWAPGTRSSVSVASLVIVAVPVAEVVFAVARRLRSRQSITTGDRRHPYDLAVERGWGRGVVALVYIGAEAVFSGAALGVSGGRSIVGPVALVIFTAAFLVAVGGRCGALSAGPAVPA